MSLYSNVLVTCMLLFLNHNRLGEDILRSLKYNNYYYHFRYLVLLAVKDCKQTLHDHLIVDRILPSLRLVNTTC